MSCIGWWWAAQLIWWWADWPNLSSPYEEFCTVGNHHHRDHKCDLADTYLPSSWPHGIAQSMAMFQLCSRTSWMFRTLASLQCRRYLGCTLAHRSIGTHSWSCSASLSSAISAPLTLALIWLPFLLQPLVVEQVSMSWKAVLPKRRGKWKTQWKTCCCWIIRWDEMNARRKSQLIPKHSSY